MRMSLNREHFRHFQLAGLHLLVFCLNSAGSRHAAYMMQLSSLSIFAALSTTL